MRPPRGHNAPVPYQSSIQYSITTRRSLQRADHGLNEGLHASTDVASVGGVRPIHADALGALSVVELWSCPLLPASAVGISFRRSQMGRLQLLIVAAVVLYMVGMVYLFENFEFMKDGMFSLRTRKLNLLQQRLANFEQNEKILAEATQELDFALTAADAVDTHRLHRVDTG